MRIDYSKVKDRFAGQIELQRLRLRNLPVFGALWNRMVTSASIPICAEVARPARRLPVPHARAFHAKRAGAEKRESSQQTSPMIYFLP